MRNPGNLGKQSSAWDSAASRMGPVAVESAKTSCPRILPALESSWAEFFRRRDQETPRLGARVAEPGQKRFNRPAAVWNADIFAAGEPAMTTFPGERGRKVIVRRRLPAKPERAVAGSGGDASGPGRRRRCESERF